MYQVEDHIPVPEKEPTVVETLEKLDVGQSMLIPLRRKSDFSAVASRQYHAKKTKRFVFATKGQPEGQARVWRKA